MSKEYPENYLLPEMRLNRFLDSDPVRGADFRIPQEAATVQATGDFATTPTTFFIQPPVGYMYEISRILILITANATITSDEYVPAGPLPNGFKLEVGVNDNFGEISPIPIQAIHDWSTYAGVDVRPLDTANQTKTWAVRWTFSKAGKPLFIRNDGPTGRVERVRVAFSDNLTTLTDHTGFNQGIIHKIS